MPKTPTIEGEATVLLELHLKELGIQFLREFMFHPERKWRFDFVLLTKQSVAIEIEGGIWSHGRHTRGQGYLRDLEKYREGVVAGYLIYRFSTEEVLSGVAKKFIAKHCL